MRKRVLFVIYSIYGGGAERQMQYILKYIDRKKFEPHLAIFHLTGKEKNVVPDDVPVYDLSAKLRPASFFVFFKLLQLIKRLRPDKILSFMWGANLIFILAGIITRVPVVISERTFTPVDLKQYRLRYIRKFEIKMLYPYAKKIIAVSKNIKTALTDFFNIPHKKIKVIENAVDIEEIALKCKQYDVSIGDYVFACGSLEKIKNFSFLIEIMAEIKNYKLIILGDGSQREYLKNKAEELGIDLILPGYVENPYPYFRNAKVFVLTSLYEGSPNVVLEAMTCGVPVVAVDCPGGVREVIKNGENGIIVPQKDKTKLVKAIKDVLENRPLREKLVSNAGEYIKKFGVVDMVKKYESLISKQ